MIQRQVSGQSARTHLLSKLCSTCFLHFNIKSTSALKITLKIHSTLATEYAIWSIDFFYLRDNFPNKDFHVLLPKILYWDMLMFSPFPLTSKLTKEFMLVQYDGIGQISYFFGFGCCRFITLWSRRSPFWEKNDSYCENTMKMLDMSYRGHIGSFSI